MTKQSAILSILFTFFITLFSCKEDKATTSVQQIKVEFKHEGHLKIIDSSGIVKQELDIEIADNTFEQQTGLMYRKKMKQNRGMLFVFDNLHKRSFYMKNTYISLDLIYIDADSNIINIIKNAEPLNEQSLPSDAPAKYVLEINAGLSDLWGLVPGDSISYTKL
ncbi:MAG: DUF192 domain-containing protein [Flavobacteriaceae bacterium]